MRVLIADDDPDLIEALRWYLEAEGYEILEAPDGEAAIRRLREDKPDLVILDIMMPKLDGFAVLQTVARESDAMVMMLSARDSEIDKVRALKQGADDYVAKPFHASELVARIQALLRRRNRRQPISPVLRWQNLELSLDEHRVMIDGSVIAFTSMEFDLLAALMGRPQVVLSREELVKSIWGGDFYGELRLVDNLVYRLREKLAGAGCVDFPISTVRGVGYAYRPEG